MKISQFIISFEVDEIAYKTRWTPLSFGRAHSWGTHAPGHTSHGIRVRVGHGGGRLPYFTSPGNIYSNEMGRKCKMMRGRRYQWREKRSFDVSTFWLLIKPPRNFTFGACTIENAPFRFCNGRFVNLFSGFTRALNPPGFVPFYGGEWTLKCLFIGLFR